MLKGNDLTSFIPFTIFLEARFCSFRPMWDLDALDIILINISFLMYYSHIPLQSYRTKVTVSSTSTEVVGKRWLFWQMQQRQLLACATCLILSSTSINKEE